MIRIRYLILVVLNWLNDIPQDGILRVQITPTYLRDLSTLMPLLGGAPSILRVIFA